MLQDLAVWHISPTDPPDETRAHHSTTPTIAWRQRLSAVLAKLVSCLPRPAHGSWTDTDIHTKDSARTDNAGYETPLKYFPIGIEHTRSGTQPEEAGAGASALAADLFTSLARGHNPRFPLGILDHQITLAALHPIRRRLCRAHHRHANHQHRRLRRQEDGRRGKPETLLWPAHQRHG